MKPGRGLATALALLGVLVLAGLLRPLLPLDETRYAAVAWEMWSRGEWLVPTLNGQPYSHKPPLLFWIIHLGWAAFGVNEWWLRLISPLCAAGSLWLTMRIARLLWPDRPAAARAAPLILVASAMFAYFATALMFDALLSLWVALGWLALLRAWRHGPTAREFALLALAIGGALFAKGPAALVHLLPVALLAPWWTREQRPDWRRWYAGVALALSGGALLILAWALPAGQAGGAAYRDAILWGQTAGRVVDSFAHQGPWWTYLALAPLLLAPWALWPRAWRGIRPAWRSDSGLRFALLGALAALAVFSLVSGKGPHYLLPEFPLVALLLARALDPAAGEPTRPWGPAVTLIVVGAVVALGGPAVHARLDGLHEAIALVPGGALAVAGGLALLWVRPVVPPSGVARVAVVSALAWAALTLAVSVAMREPYDVDTVAQQVATFEHDGRAVAVEGRYHGQWTFAGRLQQPLIELPRAEIPAWLAADPRRRAIVFFKQEDELPPGLRLELTRRYRGGWLAVLAA